MNLKPPSPLSQTFFYANSEYSVIFLIRGEPHSFVSLICVGSNSSEASRPLCEILDDDGWYANANRDSNHRPFLGPVPPLLVLVNETTSDFRSSRRVSAMQLAVFVNKSKHSNVESP